AENGILTFAYDQRGFGEDEKAGTWAKKEASRHDVLAVLGLIRKKFPGKPVFLMGESMGGAVALFALAGSEAADGLILIAPAVWGKRPVNVVYVPALWLTAHLMPGKKFSGKNLNLEPSDNTQALIALSRDPFIIKKTRIDAIYGLTRVMLRGMKSASEIQVPTFLLYGEKDDMVPDKMSRKLWKNLPGELKTRKVYNTGYHLLLRDCMAGLVWQDVLGFIFEKIETRIKIEKTSNNLCKEN
ncbi:MAG: alpha/beta fold hydrolase, partial [Sphingomonadales bacterium]